ncbi:potassium channel family protein [Deinococcus maricopensis]|uniref:TrkA-N domain protein n=1 Tax=Deinococcus maricopensis (strain DSM 21211 / LMG 22137 / NRRL B-23946 / LB-34) TaxID=709986 RepID=E8UBJ1_DEIML|nr:TrkA family potassium uptake protein [Deinococcus maricopensis]ADV68430.1 TrkA-N domain protein [Deinococcus maricopensis DSM 21211]
MKVKQCLVIGLGRFGTAVATTLYEIGHEVVAVDVEEEHVEGVMNLVTHAAILDATDERALRSIGVSDFDVVIIAIGTDIQSSILATLNAKSLGAPYVVCKAIDDTARRVLEKLGADLVIRPEHDMGVRLARQIATPNLVDTLDLGSNYAIVEIEANERLRGTLRDLNLTNRFGVQVIALNRAGNIEITPRAEHDVLPHDKIAVIGNTHGIDELRRYLGD